MTDLYSALYAKKGKSYFDSDIKSYSLLKIYPEVDQAKTIKGNSRISGDIDMYSQHQVIDMLITISARYKLTYKEISYILLCARIESGYNPDAAAGTTTAAGIGQATTAFVDYVYKNSSKRLGFVLDISGDRIFDAELGCYALVFSFLRARDLVSDHYISSSSDYWRWMYYLHHDGMSSLRLYHQNKHVISKDATDCANDIIAQMPIIESLLKTTTIETLFKLSTGDGTPVVNKSYVATVSLSPNTFCPKFVSDMNNPLIFIKGKTNSEGKTEGINALAGSEIVFTILKDNHKKLAMSENAILSEEGKSEGEHNYQSNNTNESIGGEYMVKSGDTLSFIARTHNTTINNLAKLNNLSNVNKLHVGQVLKLSNPPKLDEGTRGNANVDYISRYIPNEVKQAIIKYIGIENGNAKAAISYSRSHIVLPVGSTSADVDKNKNIVHIKTTKKSDSVKKRQQSPEKHKTDEKGIAKPTPTSNNFEPVVLPAPRIKLSLLSEKTLNILKEIMKTAGIHKIYVSSTLRTPESQVGAMYQNMRTKGIASQLKKGYYAANGRAVIQAGVDAGGIDPEKEQVVKAAMVSKILEFRDRGEKVSKHCVSEAEFKKVNVFDIGKVSLGSLMVQKAFDRAILEYVKTHQGIKYISPFKHGGEGAFHFEVTQ